MLNNHLMTAFAKSFDKRSGKTFMEVHQGRSYTFGEFYQLSGQLAQALINASVKKGDRVAVQVDKCPEAIMLYIACIRIGAVYLPLNTAYTEHELSYFIADGEPKIFVCGPEKVDIAHAIAKLCHAAVHTLGPGQGSLLEQAMQLTPITADTPCGKNDSAAILYTSGTTGQSKGAMLTHGNLASNAGVLAEYWQFTENDRLIHALPIFHIHGLFVAFNVSMVSGCSMTILEKFSIEAILDLIPTSTCLMGVPTFYSRLLNKERLSAKYVSHMRLFISGSAPLKAEIHEAFYRRTGHEILERYGMTETNMNTSNPYHGKRKAGTAGFPLPGVEVRITCRQTGAVLARNAVGSIELKGENVFKGYWRMPKKTEEAFTKDGYFITGDLGKIDEEGYLHLVGRDKDLVISSGYNIYPKEIELLIDEIDGVLESAVVGISHPDSGEAPIAIVVRTGDAEVSEQSIMQHLTGKLAFYKHPKGVFFIPALPRNGMGKIQKSVLRDQFASLFHMFEPVCR
ncbi:MAG: malonyl-CoA synthase [Waddliaceae bacterium]